MPDWVASVAWPQVSAFASGLTDWMTSVVPQIGSNAVSYLSNGMRYYLTPLGRTILDNSVKLIMPGGVEGWIQTSFHTWPLEKRNALSSALQGGDYFSMESIQAMEAGEVTAIIAAAGLKAGSAKELKAALVQLHTIRLIISTLNGNSVIVTVSVNDTVQLVKEKVTQEGLTSREHNLAHGQELLTDTSKTLAMYGVGDQTCLLILPSTVGII
jgi:hypothetical protein